MTEKNNSLLDIAFCNNTTANDDEDAQKNLNSHNVDSLNVLFCDSANAQNQAAQSKQKIDNNTSQQANNINLLFQPNKYLSSIKKPIISDRLSESDSKDLKQLCFMMGQIQCKAPEKRSHIIPDNMGSRRMMLISEDDEPEKSSQSDQSSVTTNKEVKICGILPKLPIPMSCEKITIRHYKNHVISKIGLNIKHDTCPICLSSFLQPQELDLVLLEPCQHILCQNCILEWAKKYKSNCPTCRQVFHTLWPLQWVGERELEQCELPLTFTPNSSEWDIDDDDFYQEVDGTDDQCQVCNRDINYRLMLICDDCNVSVCHTYCDPALRGNKIPESEWYCMNCRHNKTCYNVQKKTHQQQQRNIRQLNRSNINQSIKISQDNFPKTKEKYLNLDSFAYDANKRTNRLTNSQLQIHTVQRTKS